MAPKKKGKKAKASIDDGPEKKKTEPAIVLLPSYDETIKVATLMRTVSSGDPTSLTRLVAHYNYQDALLKTDLNGTTALMIAARRGDVATLDRLLSLQSVTNTNVDAREIIIIGGFSALHHACKEGHALIVEKLLQFGANADIQTNCSLGETPLQICCKTGPHTLPCARILLSLGAKPNAVDKYGNNAAFWAISAGNSDMVTELKLSNKPATAEQLMATIMSRIPNFSMPSGGKGGKKKGAAKGKKKK